MLHRESPMFKPVRHLASLVGFREAKAAALCCGAACASICRLKEERVDESGVGFDRQRVRWLVVRTGMERTVQAAAKLNLPLEAEARWCCCIAHRTTHQSPTLPSFLIPPSHA